MNMSTSACHKCEQFRWLLGISFEIENIVEGGEGFTTEKWVGRQNISIYGNQIYSAE